MGSSLARPLVFLWENIGPTHADRLAALARASPAGPPVVAIELFARSRTYPWRPTAPAGYAVHTLAPDEAGCSTPRLAWRLVRTLLAQGRADLFLCDYQRLPVFVAALVLRVRGCRVHALFTSKQDDRSRVVVRELAKRLALLPYRGGICGSPRALNYLARLGVPRARLRLGYNSLAVEQVAALADAPPAPGGWPFARRDFLAVARLVPKKNLRMAIRAYARWREGGGDGRDLHLCGAGPEEGALRAEVSRLGLGAHVHIHGFLQRQAVCRLLARALCLILTSREEQFGNVVIEAQAVGLPVLVSRAAGAADLLVEHGVNGFLLDPDDADACAALMARLHRDEACWARLARAAYAGRNRGDAARFVDAVAALAGSPAPPA